MVVFANRNRYGTVEERHARTAARVRMVRTERNGGRVYQPQEPKDRRIAGNGNVIRFRVRRVDRQQRPHRQHRELLPKDGAGQQLGQSDVVPS